ncbi:MAG: PKD domain-containing protein, partial [Oscillochloridaceae bacterium umkhey_bin13]
MHLNRPVGPLLSLSILVILIVVASHIPQAANAQSDTSKPLPVSDLQPVTTPGTPLSPDLDGYVPPPELSQLKFDSIPTQTASSTLAATCAPMLVNPTLDFGTSWTQIEPVVNTDYISYNSGPNSFRMTDGDDLSRFPFLDTADSFGQAFIMPSDADSVLVEYAIGYFNANLFDQIYYSFYLLDPFGQIIFPAVATGIAPLTIDGVWTSQGSILTDPTAMGLLRGRPVALVVSLLGDGLFPYASVWIDDVQVTACAAGVPIPREPVAGLSATNNSPTLLGQSTTFSATISAGSNVSYNWDFGDGVGTGSGATTSYTYPTVGVYIVTVTASNAVSSQQAQTVVTVTSAPVPTYTVSGRVTTANGTGLAGVTLSDGTRTATTNASGDYMLTGVPSGSYTLTPSLSGYTFSPASLSVSVSGNLSGRNFTATPISAATYTISGRVTTANGTGLAG